MFSSFYKIFYVFKNHLESFSEDSIRNFCIIAHVDHGKSTLADRLLEITGSIEKSDENKQVLDSLQVERERGITVKAQTASLLYRHEEDNTQYLLNLIDTPGHVDFNYEVSRSLASAEGAILLVDVKEGIQAQTVSNFSLAKELNLKIIPVVNKIDLKNIDIKAVVDQMEKVFAVKANDVLWISAKTGDGVEDLLKAIIKNIPAPEKCKSGPMRALIFDSWYEDIEGAFMAIVVKEGSLRVGDKITFSSSKKTYTVKSLGILRPNKMELSVLKTGYVGFLSANLKSISEVKIGDTIFKHGDPVVDAFAGFKQPKPVVFSQAFPVDQSKVQEFKNAVEKLLLNDPSISCDTESNLSLGFGMRLGFLGLLHAEVFIQRLENEFDEHVVLTYPNVTYMYKPRKGQAKSQDLVPVRSPVDFPLKIKFEEILEPYILATIVIPNEHYPKIASLCLNRRGEEVDYCMLNDDSTLLKYQLPLCEVITDFFSLLKSITSGYGTFDYEDAGYKASKITKLEILLNSVASQDLTFLVHVSKCHWYAQTVLDILKVNIPKQLFLIVLQAKVDGRIIKREEIKPYRKDVTSKLYGGDPRRKWKLLKSQAEGKRRLRLIGKVEVPKSVYIAVLRMSFKQ